MGLIDNDNSLAGYRLDYFEVYNWGNFDQKVWRVEPGAKDSLLTGKNESGKTTLIHALMTLLVPRPSFFYNQTSGQNEKRERDEKSYYQGVYGNFKEEKASSAHKLELRPGTKHYSVILAYFSNQAQTGITLAQVRWYKNNVFCKELLIAQTELNIKEHFGKLDPAGAWKNHFKTLYNAQFFGENFSQYSRKFMSLFGLKSEKALVLFAKTIGVKVLGNLNDFFRNYMLDDIGAEREFQKLRDSYETLLATYRDIEKAEKQKKLLEPIVELGETYGSANDEIKKLEETQEVLPGYLASIKRQLQETALESHKKELKILETILNEKQNRLENLREELTDLEIAKSNNKTNEQIKNLKTEIKNLEEKIREKKRKSNEYDKLAKKLNLPHGLSPEDFELFAQSFDNAGKLKLENDIGQKILSEEWAKHKAKLASDKTKFNEKAEELDYLLNNRSKIPKHLAGIRAEIANHLDVEPEKIPFAGELLKIKKNANQWESAIERLLHSFGIGLLVKKKHYYAVNQYVNQNNLNDKIVYFKVEDSLLMPQNVPENSLCHKLEIKPGIDGEFHGWMEHQLKNSFDYACTTKLEDFQNCSKALMPSGLSRNAETHEKDDSPKAISKQNYILGWDNAEKIKEVKKNLKSLDAEIKKSEKSIESNEKQQEGLQKALEDLIGFLNFREFPEINWKSEEKTRQDKTRERKDLIEGSDQLKVLENKIKAKKETIKADEKKLKEKEGNKTLLAKSKTDLENGIDGCEKILEEFKNVNFNNFNESLKPFTENVQLGLQTFGVGEKRISKNLDLSLNAKKEEKHGLETEIIKKMNVFINPGEETTNKFPSWSGDVVNFHADACHLKEYQDKYTSIVKDDLPKYKTRFKKKLNSDVINKITGFKTFLEDGESKIKNKIDELSEESLYNIDYNQNPLTYIELEYNDNNIDKAIKYFRNDLKEIMSSYARESLANESLFNETFKEIKALIEELATNETLRKKVTDVRNWLSYAAHEKYRENNKPYKYYEDSRGLSDGAKTKLAYTIMASAVAYQFNIQPKNTQHKSFRFIIIDEAFSKVDHSNVHYAMQLYRQLNLQVMVVTPLKETHIIEDYVSNYHYVEKKNDKSKVYNLTEAQYYDRKKNKFKTQEAQAR